jgi:hypothetical protein
MNPNIKSVRKVFKRKHKDEITYKVGMWKKSKVIRNMRSAQHGLGR